MKHGFLWVRGLRSESRRPRSPTGGSCHGLTRVSRSIRIVNAQASRGLVGLRRTMEPRGPPKRLTIRGNEWHGETADPAGFRSDLRRDDGVGIELLIRPRSRVGTIGLGESYLHGCRPAARS